MTSYRRREPPTKTVQTSLSGYTAVQNPVPTRQETQQKTRPVKEGEIRVYFQNVNGIKTGTREWEQMVIQMVKNQVGVFGFAETNYHWTQITTKACQVRAKIASQKEVGRRVNLNIQTSACKGWQGGRYQPGGTCTGAIDTWASGGWKRMRTP